MIGRITVVLHVGEWGGELRGSRLEAWMESQVRGCYSITFICTPTNQETVSVLEKTQTNKAFTDIEHESKYKQQQLYNKHSKHVVYL